MTDTEKPHEKVSAPTGNEEPQQHYRSAYLNEVDEIKNALARAGQTGTDPDLKRFHPIDLAAAGVVPVSPKGIPVPPKGSSAEAEIKQGEPEFIDSTTEGRSLTDVNNADLLAKVEHAKQESEVNSGKTTGDINDPGTRDPETLPDTSPDGKENEPKAGENGPKDDDTTKGVTAPNDPIVVHKTDKDNKDTNKADNK